tara:strand:+ start:4859 stop:5440 length:582 start_codon:yes stop_codon:yes gene_type:complete
MGMKITITSLSLILTALALAKQEPVLVVVEKNSAWKNVTITGLKHWEGYYPKAYRCAAGVKTIGYGFTSKEHVSLGRISQVKATNILKSKYAECGAIVDRTVTVPLTRNQRAALISFTYNVGPGSLRMLVNGKDRLNSGNYDSVPEKLVLYCRVWKRASNRPAELKELEGLKLRREWEVQIWNGKLPSKYGNE